MRSRRAIAYPAPRRCHTTRCDPYLASLGFNVKLNGPRQWVCWSPPNGRDNQTMTRREDYRYAPTLEQGESETDYFLNRTLSTTRQTSRPLKTVFQQGRNERGAEAYCR